MISKVQSIEETVKLDAFYPPVYERYYKHLFFIPVDGLKRTMVIPNCEEQNKNICNKNSLSSNFCDIPDRIKGASDVENYTIEKMAPPLEFQYSNNISESGGKTNDSEYRRVDILNYRVSQLPNKQNVHSENSADILKSFIPEGEDTCVMVHSNRICVVTLSHRHPIIRLKKSVIKVNFNVGDVDRLSNKVSGKGKKGAQVLGPFSILCIIECSDGSSYKVLSGIRGKLSEVNERLVNCPSLINESPYGEGYIAIVLPPFNEGEKLHNYLFTRSQYDEFHENWILESKK